MTTLASEVDIEIRQQLLTHYRRIRGETEQLADPLSAEDMQIQSMTDASPTKWHLAHTSWFFETFILRQYLRDYRQFDPSFHQLFNSYYNSLGTPFQRPQRGLLSRPDLDTVFAYRHTIDSAMEKLLTDGPVNKELEALIILGLNHEQQHQELLLTDIKHAFSINPVKPAYTDSSHEDDSQAPAHTLEWLEIPGGLYSIGAEGEHFYFDNEGPAHQQLLRDFRIASRLVTNGEYLEFIEDGGYREPRLWLSDGWSLIQQDQRTAPLYWQKREGRWYQFTLSGLQPIVEQEPVCHINYYEADAYAAWAGCRLPTEFEWEAAVWILRKPDQLATANMLEQRSFRPVAPAPGQTQFLGDLWEWTSSAYLPYPGFRANSGAVGEYNGKFMCNQKVLRGGSCVTPADHIRISYRNFFYPHQSWQFTGIRLAGE
ncbi:ergothioneine biosynthesis protein EgtB [Microbulbifer thermotolerans]|uniref:ergothioneine biosynthesis protein EgtB n=1 Tax=Microbulbifer thermotolerans TaxID=252514 RepID=UPI0008DF7787|nr:ergothioneine biosynthesis protein EgtB [Microbulbifer thermotolerans]MCX2794973.1 ergothioneine biosynthesis protein EgtB [Microbulbifer thermotolerans]SFB84670.1 ergothioneine biosynthesis protein EgtB [Microbulbifer thermotolerans]